MCFLSPKIEFKPKTSEKIPICVWYNVIYFDKVGIYLTMNQVVRNM